MSWVYKILVTTAYPAQLFIVDTEESETCQIEFILVQFYPLDFLVCQVNWVKYRLPSKIKLNFFIAIFKLEFPEATLGAVTFKMDQICFRRLLIRIKFVICGQFDYLIPDALSFFAFQKITSAPDAKAILHRCFNLFRFNLWRMLTGLQVVKYVIQFLLDVSRLTIKWTLSLAKIFSAITFRRSKILLRILVLSFDKIFKLFCKILNFANQLFLVFRLLIYNRFIYQIVVLDSRLN